MQFFSYLNSINTKREAFAPHFYMQHDIKVTSNIHFVLFKNILRLCFSVSNSFIHKHFKRFIKFGVLDFSF